MDVQTVSIVIAAISVVIGVINSILSNQREEEQRQVQLVSQLYDRYLSPDMIRDYTEVVHQWDFTDYKDYQPKYSITTGKYEAYNKFSRVAKFISHTCEMINLGHIGMKYVSGNLASNIINFWDKYQPVLIGSRTAVFNNPAAFDDIEAVYPLLIKQRQQEIMKYQQTTVNI
jgi:hypothetical protein